MICSACGYAFALNPKAYPRITDYAFKKGLDRVSGFGHFYFTYNQLFTQIYRNVAKKHRLTIGSAIIVGIFFLVASIFVTKAATEMGVPNWTPWVIYAGILAVLVLMVKKKSYKAPYSTFKQTIEKYKELHPIENMVDGTTFKETPDTEYAKEILKFAPEKLLIVERNDIADMLILNRFHMNHKTLVVSADKYPKRAFQIFVKILEKYPDLPVYLIHDASENATTLEDRLTSDPSWGLKNKEVVDLGLFPEDIERLSRPIWIPKLAGGKAKDKKVIISKKVDEMINKGYRMPVDTAPPSSLISAVNLGILTGAAILSAEYMDQQQRESSGMGAGGEFG